MCGSKQGTIWDAGEGVEVQPRMVPLGKAAGLCSLLFICYWFM